jgi:hypothetical protein
MNTAGMNYNVLLMGNVCDGWRGGFVIMANAMLTAISNIIVNCHGTAVGAFTMNGTTQGYHMIIVGNTIYNQAGDGILINVSADADAVTGVSIINNIISNCGAYGINFNAGTAALNDKRVRATPDYNNIYSCTSGAYNGISAGTHDLALDPQFTNSGAGDFSVGTNMKAAGFPATYP